MSARNGRSTFSQRRGSSPSSWRWRIALIVLFILVFGVRIFFFPINRTDRVSEETSRESPILLTDEWFATQHHAIQQKDAEIRESKEKLLRFEEDAGPRETWDFQDRLEWGPLHSDIGDLEGARESMVMDYNGRVRWVKRDPFKPDDPPSPVARITAE